jgi:hypothetical protein
LTRGNEAGGALQPGAAEKEFLEVPFIPDFKKSPLRAPDQDG